MMYTCRKCSDIEENICILIVGSDEHTPYCCPYSKECKPDWIEYIKDNVLDELYKLSKEIKKEKYE